MVGLRHLMSNRKVCGIVFVHRLFSLLCSLCSLPLALSAHVDRKKEIRKFESKSVNQIIGKGMGLGVSIYTKERKTLFFSLLRSGWTKLNCGGSFQRRGGGVRRHIPLQKAYHWRMIITACWFHRKHPVADHSVNISLAFFKVFEFPRRTRLLLG